MDNLVNHAFKTSKIAWFLGGGWVGHTQRCSRLLLLALSSEIIIWDAWDWIHFDCMQGKCLSVVLFLWPCCGRFWTLYAYQVCVLLRHMLGPNVAFFKRPSNQKESPVLKALHFPMYYYFILCSVVVRVIQIEPTDNQPASLSSISIYTPINTLKKSWNPELKSWQMEIRNGVSMLNMELRNWQNVSVFYSR